jgi:hypothetical protein
MRTVSLQSILLLVLIWAAATFAGCSDQEPAANSLPTVVANGTTNPREPRFVLTAPDGFEWNEEHKIWHNKKQRMTVSLAHAHDTSFQAVVDGIIADRMSTAGMELLDKEVRDVAGRPTLLVHANRLRSKYPQQCCTVAYATASGCAQLNAIYPKDTAPELKAQIETALLTSRFEASE